MDGKASIDGSDRYRRAMVESNDAWFSLVDEGLIVVADIVEVMVGKSARQFELSVRQVLELERLERAHTVGQRLAERARVVLQCGKGLNNLQVAAVVGVDGQRVWRWRKRWFEASKKLAFAEAEGATDKELAALIVGTLSDAYRCGGPQKFMAEQVALIIALACEDPAESGLPVSHWTPRELAKETVKRGIVDSISSRQVDRFLKGSGFAATQDSVLAELKDKRGGPRGLRRGRP
ncbi:helix-turn-helix domain-containing protein [Candidatus Bathyarchaeota archaeon]|nr:helix-turn-helix domain-containing protein [Candidatus Bathyarchaeota archaeon]